jgi:hypothetical protein
MATVKAKSKQKSAQKTPLLSADRKAVKAISQEKNLNLTAQLQSYFGFDSFKEPQEKIIQNLFIPTIKFIGYFEIFF